MEQKQRRSIWIKLLVLSLIVNAVVASVASYSLWQWADLSMEYGQLPDSYLSLKSQLNMSTIEVEIIEDAYAEFTGAS